MPIYEYECRSCGHQFEFLVLPSSPKAACPSCKSKSLQQQISTFAVSSDSTRASNRESARKKNAKKTQEAKHDEHIAMYHNDDH
jgi:putative FmdB family regulatory protein